MPFLVHLEATNCSFSDETLFALTLTEELDGGDALLLRLESLDLDGNGRLTDEGLKGMIATRIRESRGLKPLKSLLVATHGIGERGGDDATSRGLDFRFAFFFFRVYLLVNRTLLSSYLKYHRLH